jgi:ATP/maltotriose-dependent transcriptional regulator MalT
VRQRTLYNTLKWSYDLLDPQEQKLFHRLSIFVNGCSLQAIEGLYSSLGADAGQALDGVASLIDKCLLQHTGWDEPDSRLLTLETIREYGQECLAASGEMEAVRAAHATYYLALAEEIEPELDGTQQAMWMECLERERGNLRTAFLWLAAQGENEHDENTLNVPEMALRLAGALRLFWLVRGYLSDEQQSLERALMAGKPIAPQARAKALLTLGTLLSLQGDYNRAEECYSESLALFRQLREPRRIATALYQSGRIAWMRGDLTLARTLAEEALLYSREAGHKGSIAWSLFRLARLVIEQGEYTRGLTLLEETLAMHKEARNKRGTASSLYHIAWVYLVSQSDLDSAHYLITDTLTLFKEVGDKEGIAYSFYLSGWLALAQDDATRAETLLKESVALFKKISHLEGIAQTLFLSGRIAIARGNYAAAYTFYKESIEIASKLNHKGLLATCLEGLASLVATRTIPEERREYTDITGTSPALGELRPNIWWAARLWGMAEALRDTSGIPMLPIDRVAAGHAITQARRQLGEEAFAIAWTEGRTMSPTQALMNQKRGSISQQISRTDQEAPSRTAPPAGLTAREAEVLSMVAQGLTSAQIAEQLTLSLLTVNSHVRSIYSKLGVTSRSAATRYAIEHKLV